MGMKVHNAVKRIIASGGGDLEADSGESFRVTGIFVDPSTNDTYLTVRVDRVTVAYYRIKGKSGNHLSGITKDETGKNLMSFLVAAGLPFSIPVAEGQKLNVSRYAEAGDVQIMYDIYDGPDVRKTDPGGTEAKSYGFIQYLRESAVLSASGDMHLDTAITPAEFPDFPADRPVPSGMEILLHGIVGNPVADAASSSNLFYTSFLKLMREREVLFDEDRNGISFLGDSAATGAGDYTSGRSIIGPSTGLVLASAGIPLASPLMFDPALRFVSGEELLAYLTWVKVGTHTMPANIADIGMILEVIKR